MGKESQNQTPPTPWPSVSGEAVSAAVPAAVLAEPLERSPRALTSVILFHADLVPSPPRRHPIKEQATVGVWTLAAVLWKLLPQPAATPAATPALGPRPHVALSGTWRLCSAGCDLAPRLRGLVCVQSVVINTYASPQPRLLSLHLLQFIPFLEGE